MIQVILYLVGFAILTYIPSTYGDSYTIKSIQAGIIFTGLLIMFAIGNYYYNQINFECHESIKKCKSCINCDIRKGICVLKGCNKPGIQPPCTMSNMALCSDRDVELQQKYKLWTTPPLILVGGIVVIAIYSTFKD